MTRYLSKTKESDGRNVLHFIRRRIFHHLIPRKMNKVYFLFAFSVVYCILFVALWVFLKLVSLATYMYIRKPQDMQLLWHISWILVDFFQFSHTSLHPLPSLLGKVKARQFAKFHAENHRICKALKSWGGGGYSGFQVTEMIEGIFGVWNFRFRDLFGYENLA